MLRIYIVNTINTLWILYYISAIVLIIFNYENLIVFIPIISSIYQLYINMLLKVCSLGIFLTTETMIWEINFFSIFYLLVQCLEMTTKRKIIGRLVPCRCFRGEEEIISVLDYSHCSLQQVPKEVFNFERTLEELYLDANQIEELPKVNSVLSLIHKCSCLAE